MSVYFLYGTLAPGSRHHGILSTLGARPKGEAVLTRGYRLAVRYRGHGDDRFDRANPNHYVEPILVQDRRSMDRVCGDLYEIESEVDAAAAFGRIIGTSRSYPICTVRLDPFGTALANVRGATTPDLLYRTDPCLHRFGDGRVQFYDQATYLFDGVNIEQIPSEELYLKDIAADRDLQRVSVETFHPGLNQMVPAFQYIAR